MPLLGLLEQLFGRIVPNERGVFAFDEGDTKRVEFGLLVFEETQAGSDDFGSVPITPRLDALAYEPLEMLT